MGLETALSAVLLAYAVFPGTATDRAGGPLGGISDVRWDAGRGELVALTDRGPGDGTVSFSPRLHRFGVRLSSGGLSLDLRETTILRDAGGRPFSGLIKSTSTRLDSEGLALAGDGGYWISDEYGPDVLRFDAAGRQTGSLDVPEEYRPGGGRGRTDNQGFEGLCASSTSLTAVLQSPLAQEGGRSGAETRMLAWPLPSGPPRSYRLPRVDARAAGLEPRESGFNACVALSSAAYLLLERDGRGPGEPPGKERAVYKGVVRARVAPDGRVLREAVIDLAAAMRAAGLEPAPKLESLEPGPVLDGRPTLWSAVDNDFRPEAPTVFLLFGLR